MHKTKYRCEGEGKESAATKAERRGKNEDGANRDKTNSVAGEIRKDRQYPRETRWRARESEGGIGEPLQRSDKSNLSHVVNLAAATRERIPLKAE